jgi:hypothetical protein
VLRLDHGQPLEDVAFFPSGGLLVSAGGNYLNVWDILAGEPHKAMAEWFEHQVASPAYWMTTSFAAKRELKTVGVQAIWPSSSAPLRVVVLGAAARGWPALGAQPRSLFVQAAGFFGA